MTKSPLRFLASCLLLASPLLAAAKEPLPKTQIQDIKLDNGLRVLLVEDHSAPVYAIAVTYNVGSRDERKGRTGFAHLFEHMMFQGSQNVAKGEHMLLIEENGGGMNGTTSQDRTNYFEELPANQLDLGLFLESDRMRSLAITQANLDNQRNAVQEERRMRMDNQPYGKTFETLQGLAFDNFAYKHSTIGSMEDLNAATVADVQDFFNTYYAPNNAVLALVGDFNAKVAIEKVKKYFGNIPSHTPPPSVDVTEPKQEAERRLTITDDFAQLPMMNIAYKTTQSASKDYFALDVLFTILLDGQSARLYQKLVKEQQLAVQVSGGISESRGTDLGVIRILSRPGTDFSKVEASVYEEIAKLQQEPPADWEMTKILNQVKIQHIDANTSSLRRAIQIAQDTVFYNDPNWINTVDAHYEAVTKEDVLRVAKQYLTPSNRTVLITMPKAAATPAQSK